MIKILSIILFVFAFVGIADAQVVGKQAGTIWPIQGGTGLAGFSASGSILYSTTTDELIALGPCSDNQIVKWLSGLPTCGTDVSGGSGGTWATSTTIIYPLDVNFDIVFGTQATSTAPWWVDVSASSTMFAFGGGLNFGDGDLTLLNTAANTLTLDGGNIKAGGSNSWQLHNTSGAGSPAYSFNGDTDTGIYWGGTNQIRIGTGNGERLRITSSGISMDAGVTFINSTELNVIDGATSTVIGRLGLTIGTDVQAYDDELRDVASTTPTKGDLITSDGTDWLDFPVGTAGFVLMASSTASNGLAWVPCATLTGSADLCDGGDATGGGGASTTLDVIESSNASSTTDIDHFYWTIAGVNSSSTLIVNGQDGIVTIADLSLTNTSTLATSLVLSDFTENANNLSDLSSTSTACTNLTGNAGLCDGVDNTSGSFGSVTQIPITNTAGNDFVYTSSLTYSTSTEEFMLDYTGNGGGRAFKIDVATSTSASESVGGAFNLDMNTQNGIGAALYSNAGSAGGRLLSVVCDNAAFQNSCFHTRSDGTTTAVNISGATEGQGVIKASHVTAGDSNASILSLDATHLDYAGQGIFIDMEATTTQKILNIGSSVDGSRTEQFDFFSDGTFKIVGGTSPTTDAAGEIGFDTNGWAASRGALQVYDGTASTYLIGALTSDTPSNGQVPKWNTGGTITWENDNDTGAAGETLTVCSSGCDYTTDGTSDDVQIQQALDDGNNVVLGEENFDIRATIKVQNNDSLRGQGIGTVLTASSSMNVDVISASSTTANTFFVRIGDLKIEGDRTTNTAGHCVDATYAHSWIIENTHMDNCAVDAIHLEGDASNNALNNQIFGNRLEDPGQDAIEVGDFAPNNHIKNNIMDAPGTGYVIHLKNAETIITGNHIHSCDTHCIFTNGAADNNIISNNYIETSGTDFGAGGNGIYIVANADGNRILNNVIFNHNESGILLEGDYTSVIGNRAFDRQGTKTQDYGLSASTTANETIVMGNDFSGNLTGLIENNGVDTTLFGNATTTSNVLHSLLELNSTDGIDFNPGSDADTDLLTIGVTGTPTIAWDESTNAFEVNTANLEFTASSTIGINKAASTNAIIDLLSDGTANNGIRIQANSTQHNIFSSFQTGASQLMFTIDTEGEMDWGNGTSTVDTNLYRSAANTLRTDDTFIAGAGLTLPFATSGILVANASGAVSTSTAAVTKSVSLYVAGDDFSIGNSERLRVQVPNAATVTEINCHTTGSATSTININKANETTPGTSNDILMSSDLSCSSTFASSTAATSSISALQWLKADINAVNATSGEAMYINVRYEITP